MSHTVLTPVILLLVWLTAVRAADARAERPNIGFMLSDDQGWSGLSVAIDPRRTRGEVELYDVLGTDQRGQTKSEIKGVRTNTVRHAFCAGPTIDY